MSVRLKIVKELKDFFSVILGGSYVLYEEGLIDLNDVSDIDVLISSVTLYQGAVKFVQSQGYKCKNPVDIYGNVDVSTVATKDGEIPIHFNFQHGTSKHPWFSEPIDILCYKMQRAHQRDMDHIASAVTSGLMTREEKKK